MKVMRKPTMMSLQNQVHPKKTRADPNPSPSTSLTPEFVHPFPKAAGGKDQQIILGRKEVQKGSANNTRKKYRKDQQIILGRSTERISK
jgi:hypothetical protein